MEEANTKYVNSLINNAKNDVEWILNYFYWIYYELNQNYFGQPSRSVKIRINKQRKPLQRGNSKNNENGLENSNFR